MAETLQKIIYRNALPKIIKEQNYCGSNSFSAFTILARNAGEIKSL